MCIYVNVSHLKLFLTPNVKWLFSLGMSSQMIPCIMNFMKTSYACICKMVLPRDKHVKFTCAKSQKKIIFTRWFVLVTNKLNTCIAITKCIYHRTWINCTLLISSMNMLFIISCLPLSSIYTLYILHLCGGTQYAPNEIGFTTSHSTTYKPKLYLFLFEGVAEKPAIKASSWAHPTASPLSPRILCVLFVFVGSKRWIIQMGITYTFGNSLPSRAFSTHPANRCVTWSWFLDRLFGKVTIIVRQPLRFWRWKRCVGEGVSDAARPHDKHFSWSTRHALHSAYAFRLIS